LGDAHERTVADLAHLGTVYHCMGSADRSEPLWRQALESSQKSLIFNLGMLPEREQLLYAAQLRGHLNRYLSVAAGARLSAVSTYRFVLSSKGAVTAGQTLTRLQRRRPELAPLAAELLATGTRLANLSFAVPQPDQRDAWLKEIESLTERKESLEKTLSQKSAAFLRARDTSRVSVDRLQKSIPAKTAVVDIVAYSHCFARPSTGTIRGDVENRLTAFIVRSDDEIKRVDLGAARPIESAIRAWRQNYEATSVTDPGQILSRLVWKPIEPYLKGAETILYSPDGALCSFPLAALPGLTPGTYLIEERKIAVLPVPQLFLHDLKGARSAPSHQDAESLCLSAM